MDDFCSKMKSLIQDQHNQLIRAITSRGEYKLHPVFKEFEVNHLDWFAFDEASRAKHVIKLRSCAYKYMEKIMDFNQSKEAETLLSSSGINAEKDLPYDLLSLSNITDIPSSTIASISSKAMEILGDDGAITAAPVVGVARMVKSKSNPTRPLMMRTAQCGQKLKYVHTVYRLHLRKIVFKPLYNGTFVL